MLNSYSLNGFTLQHVSFTKDLEIYYSSIVCFKQCIDIIAGRALKVLGLIITILSFLFLPTVHFLFISLVQSLLEYGVVI